jgi:hypothetical protein
MRVVTEDPYQGQLEVPWTQRLVAHYVGNNALNLWDPSGYCSHREIEMEGFCESMEPGGWSGATSLSGSVKRLMRSETGGIVTWPGTMPREERPVDVKPLADGTEIRLYEDSQFEFVDSEGFVIKVEETNRWKVTTWDEGTARVARLAGGALAGSFLGSTLGLSSGNHAKPDFMDWGFPAAGAVLTDLGGDKAWSIQPAGTVVIIVQRHAGEGWYERFGFSVTPDQNLIPSDGWAPLNHFR